MHRGTTRGNKGVNKHNSIKNPVIRELKRQIESNKYPICCFCGKPITIHSQDVPESLSVEFNMDGKCFAEAFNSGDIRSGVAKEYRKYCMPAHIGCNRFDNIMRQNRLKKNTNKG